MKSKYDRLEKLANEQDPDSEPLDYVWVGYDEAISDVISFLNSEYIEAMWQLNSIPTRQALDSAIIKIKKLRDDE